MMRPKKSYSILADKIAVRKYVEEKIGGDYLIPLIWTGERLTAEVWDNLPEMFVLKANHASGTNLIVKSKSALEFKNVEKLTNKWLAMNFSKVNLEKHYKYIKPKLMAEQLLITETGSIPYDYKVHCFNSLKGPKYFIQVDYDRFENNGIGHTRDFFDQDWNFLDFTLDYPNAYNKAKKPESLHTILELSHQLSEELAYARVDWYIFNNKLLFGEITLTHGCAGETFTPEIYNKIWGDLWDINYEK